MPPPPPKSAVHKPLKRPSQARARFTVQAIYDGMVRIWLRDGPDAVTTKAVAAETGFAVGTLYDYFPNRTALFSGYVRHCIDDLLRRLDEDALAARALPWPERLSRMVRMTCGADGAAPCFDHAMLTIEHAIAEDKHHRRVYEELSEAWVRIIQTWPDLPPGVDARRIRALSSPCLAPAVMSCWSSRPGLRSATGWRGLRRSPVGCLTAVHRKLADPGLHERQAAAKKRYVITLLLKIERGHHASNRAPDGVVLHHSHQCRHHGLRGRRGRGAASGIGTCGLAWTGGDSRQPDRAGRCRGGR